LIFSLIGDNPKHRKSVNSKEFSLHQFMENLMKYVTLIILLLLFVLSSQLFAQENDVSLIINGNFSLPTGDYGRAIGDNPIMTRRAGFDFGGNVGLASFGYGLGAEIISPVGFSGLEWMLSSRFLLNSTNNKSVQQEFRHQLGDSVNVSIELGNWINIPIMTGLRYRYLLIPNLFLYGIVQGGINISKAPSLTVRVAQYTAENTEFEFTRDFGFEVGFGVELLNNFDISVRYLSLNTPRYEGTRKLSERLFPQILSRENAILGEERSIAMFLVTIGYQLF